MPRPHEQYAAWSQKARAASKVPGTFQCYPFVVDLRALLPHQDSTVSHANATHFSLQTGWIYLSMHSMGLHPSEFDYKQAGRTSGLGTTWKMCTMSPAAWLRHALARGQLCNLHQRATPVPVRQRFFCAHARACSQACITETCLDRFGSAGRRSLYRSRGQTSLSSTGSKIRLPELIVATVAELLQMSQRLLIPC